MDQVITAEIVFAVIAASAVIYGWIKGSGDKTNEVLTRLTRLETKLDGLADTVEKHNKVVERTFKIESDLNTAFKHIDRMRDDVDKINTIKLGGTE